MTSVVVSLAASVRQIQVRKFGAVSTRDTDYTLTGGAATLDMEPTGADWCYQFTEHGTTGVVRFCTVPDVASVNYASLTDVDPATLLVVAEPADPAWVAAVESAATSAASAAVGSKVNENELIFNSKRLTVAGNRKQSWSGAMTSGSAVLTVAGGFQSGDVGKAVTVAGAGAAGATLRATILTYTSGTTVTLSATASTTVSGKYAVWGTDDTAALQAAIDATWPATGSNPKRGGELLLAKGQHCMITGTLFFRRPTGTFRGAGWADWAGYPSTTLGSMIFWDGPAGVPMIQVEGSTFFRIEGLGLIGNPGADSRPSSIIRFYTPTSVFNEQASVKDCLIGRYSTYGGFNGGNSERVADNGIIMDGDNAVNDRWRITGCRIEGNTVGLNLPNSQSVVGKVASTTFAKNDTHVTTYAQVNFDDCYFSQAATRDFELQSSARVKLDECASELAPQMVYMRGPSTFRWHSGYFQVSGSTRPDKVIVDAVSNHRQVIRLIDVQINPTTGWTVTDHPVIECHAAGATAPGNAMSNKVIELRNVRYPGSTNIGVTESWFNVTPLSTAESIIVYGDVQPAGAGDQNHGVEQFFWNRLTAPTDTLDFTRDDQWRTQMLSNPAILPTDLPSGAVAQTFERRQAFIAAAVTSGRLAISAIYLRAGQTVSSATFTSGTTAMVSGTHGWAALFSPNLGLLGQSADDTGITWAASTDKTFTLASPVTIEANGWYYVGLCTAASTQPTLMCLSNHSASLTAQAIGGWSTTGLTGTAPATAAAPVASSYPYAYVS